MPISENIRMAATFSGGKPYTSAPVTGSMVCASLPK